MNFMKSEMQVSLVRRGGSQEWIVEKMGNYQNYNEFFSQIKGQRLRSSKTESFQLVELPVLMNSLGQAIVESRRPLPRLVLGQNPCLTASISHWPGKSEQKPMDCHPAGPYSFCFGVRGFTSRSAFSLEEGKEPRSFWFAADGRMGLSISLLSGPNKERCW